MDNPHPIKHRSLIFNAKTNYAALIVSLLVGFILTPYIIIKIGALGYGVWAVVGALVGYLSLLDLGISSAIVRYVAHFRGKNDDESISETINVAFLFFLFVSIFLLILSIFLADPLSNFFSIPVTTKDDFRILISLMAGAIGLGLISNTFNGALRAYERYGTFNCIVIGTTVVRAIAIFIFLEMGYKLSGLGWANLIAAAAGVIANFAAFKTILPLYSMRFYKHSLKSLFDLMQYGGGMLLLALAGITVIQAGPLIIGKLLSFEKVAIYAIALMVFSYMVQMMSSTFTVLTPRLSFMHGEGDRHGANDLLLRSISLSALLAFWGSAVALLAFKPFSFVWVGPGFADATTPFWIIVFGSAFSLAQLPIIPALEAEAKHYGYAIIVASEALLNITLSIILVRRLGIMGVALGMATALFICRGLIASMYACRTMKIPTKKYWGQILPHALCGLITVGVLAPWLGQRLSGRILDVVIAAGAAMVVFMAAGAGIFVLGRRAGFTLSAYDAPLNLMSRFIKKVLHNGVRSNGFYHFFKNWAK